MRPTGSSACGRWISGDDDDDDDDAPWRMAPPRSETPGMVVALLLLLLMFVAADDRVCIPEAKLLDTSTSCRGEVMVVNATLTRGVFVVRDTDTTPAPVASKRRYRFDRKETEFASDFFMTTIEVVDDAGCFFMVLPK